MVMPNVPTPAVPQGLLDKILSLFGGGGNDSGGLGEFMDSLTPGGATGDLPGNSPLFTEGGSGETGLTAEFLQAVRDGTVEDFFKKHPELTLADLQDFQRALAEAPAGEGLGNDAISEKAKAGELGDKMQEKASALPPEAIMKAREQLGAQLESRGAKFLDTDMPSLRSAYKELQAQTPEWDMPWDAFKAANSKADRANGGAIPKGTFLIISANAATDGERTYTAVEGDTPQKIAEKTGASLSDIMTQLGVTDPSEQLVPGKDKVVITPPPGRAETRGEGTMPQATGAPLPGEMPPGGADTKPAAKSEFDNLYETDPSLLIEALIGSKNYAPGYAANKSREFGMLEFLDSLKYSLDPGSVPTDQGTGARLAEMFGAGQTYDPMALLTQAQTDPEYRNTYEDPANENMASEVAKLLFGLRSQSLPSEASSVYTGGYIDKLYYEYLQQAQGQENAPTFLQFLVEKGL